MASRCPWVDCLAPCDRLRSLVRGKPGVRQVLSVIVGSIMIKTRICAATIVALMTLAVASQDAQSRGGNKNPGVIPPNARYRGLSYGEWGARFWQAAFAIPVVGG